MNHDVLAENDVLILAGITVTVLEVDDLDASALTHPDFRKLFTVKDHLHQEDANCDRENDHSYTD
jgi:hypothetical protein